VAMSFKKEMDDTFYFGIFEPIRANGFICERIDSETFTGGVLQQIKIKIENSNAVIADLTRSTANVYLKAGYGWGKMFLPFCWRRMKNK
jgi:hypothetical protein